MTHLGGLLQPTFLTPLSFFCPEHGPGPWPLCAVPPCPSRLSGGSHQTPPCCTWAQSITGSPRHSPHPYCSLTLPTVRILSPLLHTFSAPLCWIPKPSCGLQPEPYPLPLTGQCFCLRTFIHAALSTWKALTPVFTRPTSAHAANVTSLKRPVLMLEPHLAPHKAGLSFTDMSCFVPVL